MNKIVVGLGFGDEGKGLTTSFLSENSSPNSIVVRHNGGQQAGHTVVYKGRQHIFSQLGAGTLQGLPTYFTKDCTFYPSSFLREYKMLSDLAPRVILNPLTMITLPIDIDINRGLEDNKGDKRHGSVGMGFGTTVHRNQNHYTLYAQDLFYPKILEAKLRSIYINWYGTNPDFKELKEDIIKFLDDVKKVLKLVEIVDLESISKHFNDVIFETAQGVLLDQYHGFFPNVTRSNTTSKNALGYCYGPTEIYYVTRTYQTRHGAGFMTNEEDIPVLVNNKNETNKSHKYQGEFRIARLDTELLKFAIQSDNNYSKNCKKNLVITCNDQLAIDWARVVQDLTEGTDEFDKVFLSYGPSLDNIKQVI